MKGLPIIILFSFIWGCTEEVKVVSTLNPDEHLDKRKMKEIGEFLDSTFNDDSDLNKMLEFNSISNNGTIKKVDMEKGINLYSNLLYSEKVSEYPIFEINNSSKAILVVKGKGLMDIIWAKILIDKNTNIIERIEFDHKSETPGIGTKIMESEFENQFIGLQVYFDKNTCGLTQDKKEILKGEYQIDGVSGATFTSQGAIEMINEGVLKYKEYLRQH